MFAVSLDYVTAQETGNAFAADYYGRINDACAGLSTTRSVAELFTERSRYYEMDSLNDRPAVGRANAVRALRRFCGYYSEVCRRVVLIVSVDVQNDNDDDDYDDDDDDRRTAKNDRYALFVKAEWTDPGGLLVAVPFIQTFHIRRLRSEDEHFEIVSTMVKMIVAPTTEIQLPVKTLERGDDKFDGQALEFMLPFQNTHELSVQNINIQKVADNEQDAELVYKMNMENETLTCKKYLDYQKKVMQFLDDNDYWQKKPANPMFHNISDSFFTNRLYVDRLNYLITADELYTALCHYGKVLKVRIISDGENTDHRPGSLICYSAQIDFEQTETVDRIMIDHRGPGFLIKGIRLRFRKAKYEQ